MANVYHVTTNDGKAYDITTSEHHDDHTDNSFKTHLGKIVDGAIGGTAGGVASAVIIRFVFKGKK